MTNDEFRKNDEARISSGEKCEQDSFPSAGFSDDLSHHDSDRLEEEFWFEASLSQNLHLHEDAKRTRVFDLEERTAQFGESIIRFAKSIPRNAVTTPLISQLVRAGTSVGANYCEADDGVSRKDFKNKIGTCRKEARETTFHLRMVATSEPSLKPEARILWQEAKELHLIFSAIWRK